MKIVAVEKRNTDGYDIFRIPGIICTSKGSLIAYCECRMTGADWAPIDIGMRKSKNEAIQFINENESADREYYAGFLGWYDTKADTRLFVNLRCMKWIDKQTVKLIAGGGILPESELESEWRETENKMQTLTRLNSFR